MLAVLRDALECAAAGHPIEDGGRWWGINIAGDVAGWYTSVEDADAFYALDTVRLALGWYERHAMAYGPAAGPAARELRLDDGQRATYALAALDDLADSPASLRSPNATADYALACRLVAEAVAA